MSEKELLLKKLITDLCVTQAQMAHAANSRRGISKRLFTQERREIKTLLSVALGYTPTKELIDETIKDLG